jgi:hypothetical protein
LLRGEKTVNEALRKVLEVQAMFLVARSLNERQDIPGEPISAPH